MMMVQVSDAQKSLQAWMCLGAEDRQPTGKLLTREAAVVGEGLSGRLLFASLSGRRKACGRETLLLSILAEPAYELGCTSDRASALSGNNRVLSRWRG